MTLFDECIRVILRNEGGYQANPNDSGNWVGGYKTGKLVGTKYGIAGKFFPNVDIKNLTEEGAKQIYYTYYWKPMNLEGIGNELAVLHIFDHGVNAGKGTAIRMAQRIVGVKADGVCGSITTKAINGSWDFVRSYIEERKDYYKKVSLRGDNKVFLSGWLRRIDKTAF